MPPKVSVIMPVYNVKLFMEKSFRSIMEQTYRNIEIIAVDDGSTDGSGEICDRLAKLDSRIQVYHKPNGGLSSARNYGLKYATGELLMFVDSDDWLDSDCISICVKELREQGVDCVLFPYIREFRHQSKPNFILGKESRILCKDELSKRLFGPLGTAVNHPQNMDDLNMACCKIYYSKFVDGMQFLPKAFIGPAEDLAFNAELFLRIESFLYIPSVFYHYNKMNEHAITATYDGNIHSTQQNVYNYLKQLIQKYMLDETYSLALLNRRLLGFFVLGLNIVRASDTFWQKYMYMRNLLFNAEIQRRFFYIDFSKFNISWKIFWGLCKYKQAFIVLVLLLCADRLKAYLK